MLTAMTLALGTLLFLQGKPADKPAVEKKATLEGGAAASAAQEPGGQPAADKPAGGSQEAGRSVVLPDFATSLQGIQQGLKELTAPMARLAEMRQKVVQLQEAYQADPTTANHAAMIQGMSRHLLEMSKVVRRTLEQRSQIAFHFEDLDRGMSAFRASVAGSAKAQESKKQKAAEALAPLQEKIQDLKDAWQTAVDEAGKVAILKRYQVLYFQRERLKIQERNAAMMASFYDGYREKVDRFLVGMEGARLRVEDLFQRLEVSQEKLNGLASLLKAVVDGTPTVTGPDGKPVTLAAYFQQMDAFLREVDQLTALDADTLFPPHLMPLWQEMFPEGKAGTPASPDELWKNRLESE